MITFTDLIADVAVAVLLYMTIIFVLSLLRKDNSVADVAWGFGFVVVAVYSVIQSGEADLRKMIVCTLVLLWGLRLSYHIMVRNSGKGEGLPYRTWRDTWKYFIPMSYFRIYILRGVFMLVISAPVWFIGFRSGGPIGPWDSLGLLLFGAGFMIETYADYQLAGFKRDPENRGKILTKGLWSVSRHPNYFGEALVWWGIGCYTLSLPGGWMTLAGPAVITILLRFFTGVPRAEKKMQDRPGWEEYKSKTAPFVPFMRFL